MKLGISSRLEHSSPKDWASKHKALGLKSVNFPVCYLDGEETFMAYKQAADEAGLTIAEVGVWRNTLAADKQERRKWIDYAVQQLRMADAIGALCCVNVVGTPYGPRWDGGYRENFSKELWTMAVEMIRALGGGLSYMMVNEAGASVYSASPLAAQEFPQFDVNLRSAVSIARRLQDPLSELVKIEPKAIGVGQYQHDCPQKRLDEAREAEARAADAAAALHDLHQSKR